MIVKKNVRAASSRGHGIGMRFSCAPKRSPLMTRGDKKKSVLKTNDKKSSKSPSESASTSEGTTDLEQKLMMLMTMEPADMPGLLASFSREDVREILANVSPSDISKLLIRMTPETRSKMIVLVSDEDAKTFIKRLEHPGRDLPQLMQGLSSKDIMKFVSAMEPNQIKQLPKSMVYDLERKQLFMEEDTRKHLTLAWVRMLSYVYGLGKLTKGKDVFTHVDIIKKHLKERFNHDFPLAHDRVYVQHGATNMATIKDVYTDTVTKHECYMMSSSGYCGMGMKPEILEAAIEETRKVGTLNYGSCGAIGVNEQVSILNQTIAKYYRRKIGLSCVSGFLACQNLMDHLITSGSKSGDEKTLVLLDKYAHRSLSQGSLQADKTARFEHNSAEDARRLLLKHGHEYAYKIIVIESVYSTVGDIGDLPAIKKVCDEFGCILICDDAHGIGVLGPNAGGVEDHFDMVGACDYICGTLSKACSSQGGYVVSNHESSIGCLVFSPGIGFATGMNSFSASFATKALEYIMSGNGKRQVVEAKRLREYMQRKLFERLGIKIAVPDSPSRLCTIVIDHPTLAMHIQCELLTLGYYTCFFVFPATLMHQSLLRITIIPDVYTTETIDGFINSLEIALERTEKIRAVTQNHLLFTSLEEAEKANQATKGLFSMTKNLK